jgi:hypothetical protein
MSIRKIVEKRGFARVPTDNTSQTLINIISPCFI